MSLFFVLIEVAVVRSEFLFLAQEGQKADREAFGSQAGTKLIAQGLQGGNYDIEQPLLPIVTNQPLGNQKGQDI